MQVAAPVATVGAVGGVHVIDIIKLADAILPEPGILSLIEYGIESVRV